MIRICFDRFNKHAMDLPQFSKQLIPEFIKKSQLNSCINTQLYKDLSRLINGRMNHESITSYFNILKLDSSFAIIDNVLSTTLVDGNWLYLTSFPDISDIKRAHTIFCLVQPPNFHACLLVIEMQCWQYYILNPSTMAANENLRIYCTVIIEKLSEFACFQMNSFTINSCYF